jgi:hypothetical protein
VSSDDHLRAEIAATAARLIAEEGCEYGQAKRRAVHELVGDARIGSIPDNAEVERELRRYLKLFEGDTYARRQSALRQMAVRLMERLADFEPHLTGAVLNGTATPFSDIHLQLFVDSAKDVEVFLMNEDVEFDVDDGPPDDRPRMLERLTFVVPAPDDIGLARHSSQIGIHLQVFPRNAIRTASRSRSDATADPGLHAVEASGRASLSAVRRLIADTSA